MTTDNTAPIDTWNGLDLDARVNLRSHDLAEFFRHQDRLRQDGHAWLNDAHDILAGWIWDKIEGYEEGPTRPAYFPASGR